jgi:sec-independent protein translocase protein TatC
MSEETTPASDARGREMPLMAHLGELRTRLVRCLIAAVVGFFSCFAFHERILIVMLKPLKDALPPKSELITTTLTEGFGTSMKAAFVAGLFLTSPFIFYQIWKFVAPGLYKEERTVIIPVAILTALFFVCGALFGYYVVFPYGFSFLANFGSELFTLMPTLKDYFSFSLMLLLAFGVIFETPVFIFFLAYLGLVTSKGLRKNRRWAILVAFVTAAMLTPPDAVSQCLMAVPMIILYEISIWGAYFFGKERLARRKAGLPAPVEPEEPETKE